MLGSLIMVLALGIAAMLVIANGGLWGVVLLVLAVLSMGAGLQ